MPRSSPLFLVNKNTPTVPLYRPDVATSAGFEFDGIQPGECSSYYLSTLQTPGNLSTATLYDYMILRVKLPYVFVRPSDEDPDQTFDSPEAYQVRYWSVSSHFESSYPPPELPETSYWTVSARTLELLIDPATRVGFVFFVPAEEAVALQQAQNLDCWEAPILTLADGSTQGVVLPSPDFVIFRYRVPDPEFEGSPANAPCYQTPDQNKPLEPDSLGEFTPILIECSALRDGSISHADAADVLSMCPSAFLSTSSSARA